METIEFIKQYWGGLTFLLVLILIIAKDKIISFFKRIGKPNYGFVDFDKQLNILPTFKEEREKANAEIANIESEVKGLFDYEKKLDEYIRKQVTAVAERKKALGYRMHEWQSYLKSIDQLSNRR